MIKFIYYINIILFMFIYSKVLANTDIDSLANPPVKARLMLIIDSSGSMSEKDMSGNIKINVAKTEMSDILAKISNGVVSVSLMAYDNCQTRVMVPPSNTNIGRVQSRAMSIYPEGQTPIAKSIREAGQILGNSSKKTTVILISDGQETCGGDPCAETERLKQRSNLDLKFHAVGYAVDDKTRLQLQCIAKAGEGKYFDIQDSFSLGTAIHSILKEDVTKDFDEDADGVRDQEDRCSGTFWGFSVDNRGCEISYTIPILFAFGASKINLKILQPAIKPLINYMKIHKEKKFQIQGHADSIGTDKFNQALSERRAKFIKDQLIKYGVSSKRLFQRGFGEKLPVASNLYPLGRQKNRRIEVHFIK